MSIFTDPKQKRFVLHPIRHDNLWSIFKQQQQVMWSTEEIDFSQDDVDWKKMDEDTKHFILTIVAFFAGSDMLIIDNLMDNFMSEVTVAECKTFYTLQAFVETIHSETYSLMLTKFAKGKNDELFDAINKIESIKAKADWARKYMDNSLPFEHRLWAFIIFEGVLFSASFCSLYWLRTKNLCHGLTFSNELIARDEALHASFGVEMFKMIKNKPSKVHIHRILNDAIKCEMAFVDEALPKKLKGINSDTMKQYVKYCGDHLLGRIGYESLYNVKNPYAFMDMISLDSKSNFFEKRVSEYQMAGVGHNQEDMGFTDAADF